MIESTAILIAVVFAICWWAEIRGAARLAKDYAKRTRSAHARGWEEGRLYEYNRREPKRGQGGRFAPKKQGAATAELLEP